MVKGETYLGIAIVLLLVIVLIFAGSFNDKLSITGNVVGDNVTGNETEEVEVNETETNETIVNETAVNETETNETTDDTTDDTTTDTTDDTTDEVIETNQTTTQETDSVDDQVSKIIKELEEQAALDAQTALDAQEDEKINIPLLTGNIIEGTNETCFGCVYNDKCYEVNDSKKDKYCLPDLTWTNQSEFNTTCVYDFECESGNCLDERCAKFDILKEIIDFLKKLFTTEQEIVENAS